MLHPTRPRGGFVVLGLLAAAFFGISRTSGAGWATVLVAGVIGTCAASFVLPAFILARPRLTIAPAVEGTVGSSLDLVVAGRDGIVADVASLATGEFALNDGVLRTVPQRRGVFTSARVNLRSSAPLGLVEWRRSITVTFPESVEIGPAPLASVVPPPQQRFEAGDELLRGVRPYEPGDSVKMVHWPATARTGSLAVRQYDAPAQPELVILVDLNGDEDAAEALAGRAAGLAGEVLAGGATVMLATCEVTGPRTERVSTRSEVNRRLARAIAGPLKVIGDAATVKP
jgi:uncharacterized protein (DUF58 family)